MIKDRVGGDEVGRERIAIAVGWRRRSGSVRRARQLPGALLAAAPRARRSDGEGGRHVHSHPMSGQPSVGSPARMLLFNPSTTHHKTHYPM
jgi:hypothetical protein